jgi:hypothetical protein
MKRVVGFGNEDVKLHVQGAIRLRSRVGVEAGSGKRLWALRYFTDPAEDTLRSEEERSCWK